MTRQYTRLLTLIFLGSGLAPLVTYAASGFLEQYRKGGRGDWMMVAAGELIRWQFLAVVVLVFAATAIVWRLLLRFEPMAEATALRQAEFLVALGTGYVEIAIFGSAALSLLFELAIMVTAKIDHIVPVSLGIQLLISFGDETAMVHPWQVLSWKESVSGGNADE